MEKSIRIVIETKRFRIGYEKTVKDPPKEEPSKSLSVPYKRIDIRV